jgi:hypothetical protein
MVMGSVIKEIRIDAGPEAVGGMGPAGDVLVEQVEHPLDRRRDSGRARPRTLRRS